MKCWLLHRDGVRLRGQVVRSVSSIDPSVNRPFIVDEVRERITELLHVPPLATRSVTPLRCAALRCALCRLAGRSRRHPPAGAADSDAALPRQPRLH